MTKPLIGTAILMLVDDGTLALDDPVAKHLPALDVEGWRGVTLQHLITHTSGLPFSLIAGRDLRELGGIQAVAALGATYELDFEPGSAFAYSDQGTDTLTAVVEAASGMPAADFVRTRILAPLGMHDSTCVLSADHPLRARAIPKYMGSPGDWTRFWGPDDPPLFPFFLGSQGLYSTALDYARFLDFWRLLGRTSQARLLKARLARKALRPTPLSFPTGSGFAGLASGYGSLMQVWTRPDGDDAGELAVFGHNGSDGTYAWAFPERKALVLYFTQSRGNPTGLRVEEVLGELFLGAPFDPNEAAPPLEQYLGFYWEGEGDLYRAIVRDGDGLALEVMGKGVVPLAYAGDDRWKIRDQPGTVLAFDRSPAGEVTGYHIGDHRELRFEPAPDLPCAADLAQRVAAAHRLDLLETLGPLRIRSTVRIESLDLTGRSTSLLAWPDRYRIDTEMGEELESAAVDGDRVWYASARRPLAEVDGVRGEAMRLDQPFARFGDWSRWHPTLEVIQRFERKGEEVFLVRAGDLSRYGTNLYVHGGTGRLVRAEEIVYLDGMGRVGQSLEFSDFRDVSGMTLPFRIEIEIPSPVIGTVVATVDEVELGVEVPAGTFELAN
jgi:CubicO group peptidase (beta-lactamase class C family)